MSERKFHHGNLRAALLELAETELELNGYEALSLRELATKLDVSRGAPYRHFESKNALLVALAGRGVERLRSLYQRACEMAAAPSERLAVACKAYLDFAKERPELFRLIFVSNADWYSGPTADFEPPAAFNLFKQLVASNEGAESEEEAQIETLACWSLIHGFAMLRMHGRLTELLDIPALETVEPVVLARAVQPPTAKRKASPASTVKSDAVRADATSVE